MARGLTLKYFVLTPAGYDCFAVAARQAMIQYAEAIDPIDPRLAADLREWVETEREKGAKEEKTRKRSGPVLDPGVFRKRE